jgi:hypothetical protein
VSDKVGWDKQEGPPVRGEGSRVWDEASHGGSSTRLESLARDALISLLGDYIEPPGHEEDQTGVLQGQLATERGTGDGE